MCNNFFATIISIHLKLQLISAKMWSKLDVVQFYQIIGLLPVCTKAAQVRKKLNKY